MKVIFNIFNKRIAGASAYILCLYRLEYIWFIESWKPGSGVSEVGRAMTCHRIDLKTTITPYCVFVLVSMIYEFLWMKEVLWFYSKLFTNVNTFNSINVMETSICICHLLCLISSSSCWFNLLWSCNLSWHDEKLRSAAYSKRVLCLWEIPLMNE